MARGVVVLKEANETFLQFRRIIGKPDSRPVPHKNERVQLEMKIMKYRQLARLAASDEITRQRVEELIAELEIKLREIDE